MIGKKIFLVLATFVVLLLQFADCMSAITPDQESMECCGSMPCTQANQSHDCCKTMVSGQIANLVPMARASSFDAPVLAIVRPLTAVEIVRVVSSPFNVIEAQQHSPPELYTLHVSLLI